MSTTDFHGGPPGLSQCVPQGLAGAWGCHLKLPPPSGTFHPKIDSNVAFCFLI